MDSSSAVPAASGGEGHVSAVSQFTPHVILPTADVSDTILKYTSQVKLGMC